ncbi:MAG: MATE family efflux transporter [Nocardioides sp.]
MDGLWLAALIGSLATVAGVALARPVVGVFGADAAVADAATTYLRIAVVGTTPLCC